LIDNGANINTKNNGGRTPLHYLCEHYKNENAIKEEKTLRRLVSLFEKYGASIIEKDNSGRTPNDYLIRRDNSINMLPMEATNQPEAANVRSNPIIIDEVIWYSFIHLPFYSLSTLTFTRICSKLITFFLN